MFDNLTDRLSGTFRKIRGKANLTEANIQEALREVRRPLLDADVALSVVKDFIDRVSLRAIGQEVSKSLSPGQAFIKIVQAELEAIMGSANAELDLKAAPPAIVLMAGLQGAGKTTTVAKLARWLKNDAKKSVMVVSADVYRPAAIQQLQTLAAEVEVENRQPAVARAAVREELRGGRARSERVHNHREVLPGHVAAALPLHRDGLGRSHPESPVLTPTRGVLVGCT